MNPALPGGALASEGTGDDAAWSVSARAGYTFVPYGHMQQGRDEAPNPNGLAIDVHLATLQVIASAPFGTSLDVQLPGGSLVTATLAERRVDHGVGDLEVRARQALGRLLGAPALGLGAALGAVLPTGPYVPRSGAANLPPEAAYLTLGRGSPWGLVELDVRAPFATRWAVHGQMTGRIPLAWTSDDFAWGTELRVAAGVAASFGRWTVGAASDVQWRGGATEPDPFSMIRLTSANAGGWQWSLAPSVVARVTRALSIVAGVRIPVVSDVTGNQLVPQTGAFVALGYTHRPPASSAGPAIAPTRGMLTVVDYWATWCAPCAEIDHALAAAAPRWPDVRIVRVDATAWPGEGAPALPAGAQGLPVIEILDDRGARVALLVGEEARRIVEKIDALRARKPLP